MEKIIVVEEELKKGWEATSQLQSLVARIEGDNKSSNEFEKERILNFSENYCDTIINSFNTCLSILKNKEASNVQISSYNRDTPNTHALGKTGQNMTLKSKNPRYIFGSSTLLVGVKTFETPNLVPDRYLWRKYGQKPILHSRHPREYYRCAYKDDQQCQATKHVQKILDNPPKYKITYYCNHTCNPDLLGNKVAQVNHMLDFEKNDCTNLICFESKIPSKVPKQAFKQEVVFNSSSPFRQGNMLPAAPLADNDRGPSTSNVVDSREIMEPSLAGGIAACRDKTEVVYSPNTVMSPTYMASSSLQVEDYVLAASDEKYFEMNGALELQDLSLWEDDEVIPYTYID